MTDKQIEEMTPGEVRQHYLHRVQAEDTYIDYDPLTRRIARDHPDVLARWKGGEFDSVAAAANAAGITDDDEDDAVIADDSIIDAWIYTDTSLPPSPDGRWYRNKITMRVTRDGRPPGHHMTLTPDQAVKLAHRLLTLAYECGTEISE
jgi:hypothetical protein